MTTFEITIIVLLAAIVVLLAWHCTLTRNNYSLNQTKELKRQQDFERLLSKLQSIVNVCNQQQNAWACDVTSIVKRINELTDIVDKMHRNLCVEIADKMVDRAYPPTYVTPCIVETLLKISDALVAELKRSDDVHAECRRMDAINTASVCENMTKIQKELQKKGGQGE